MTVETRKSISSQVNNMSALIKFQVVSTNTNGVMPSRFFVTIYPSDLNTVFSFITFNM